ncbi:MAG: MATE family efflux transporter [Lachnospiraceae bacterium]
MTTDLTKGKPWRVILLYTLPIIAGNMFQQLYSMVDTLIVGRTMGSDALAAVGSTTTIVYFVLCFIQGLTTGFSVITGQRFGSGDPDGIRQSAGISTVLCVLFSVILTAVTVLLCDPILRLMNTPSDIFQYSHEYLIVIFIGTGATVFYNMISNLLRSLGDSRTPLLFLIVSSLLNVFLDILFIVPFHMGVAGAAWATILSQLLSAVLCLVYALKKFPLLRLSRRELTFHGHLAAVHLKMGFPMGLQMSVMCIGQLAMQSFGQRARNHSHCRIYCSSKLDQFAVQINNAYCTSSAGDVAQNFGAGDRERIRNGSSCALLQAIIISLSVGLLMIASRSLRSLCFWIILNRSSTLMHPGFCFSPCLFIRCSAFFVYTASSALQSMNRAAYPFIACLIELVLRLISSLGLSRIWGFTMICLSSPFAWIGAAIFLAAGYFHVMRAKN